VDADNPVDEISRIGAVEIAPKFDIMNRSVTDIIPARVETPAAIASSSTEAIKK